MKDDWDDIERGFFGGAVVSLIACLLIWVWLWDGQWAAGAKRGWPILFGPVLVMAIQLAERWAARKNR